MINHRTSGWCDCLSCTQYVPPPADSETRPRSMPVTRGECIDGPRPCPWKSCRYHMEHARETCALDVADRGPHESSEVAALIGVTRQRVNGIERSAMAKLSKRAAKLAAELDRGGKSISLRDRLVALIADSLCTTAKLCEETHEEYAPVRCALRKLRDAGIVEAPAAPGGVWRLIE